MASSSKNVLSIQGSDNGTILDNSRDESCKEVENESFTLMNEFRSLYADKLKAIEENCEDPTEPKIRTLQEWINDLTEQNLVLIKTVEELEKEALNRVNTFNNLALEAKEVTHKDSREEALEKRLSVTLQNRVSDLQIALNKNDFTLEKCKTEIKDLSRQLEEKNKEVDSLRCSGERLVELQNKIQELENDLQSKCEEITCLREKNQQLSLETNGALRRSEELKCKVNNLQSEINERDSQLQQKCASIQNVNREKTAAEERQCLMREELNRLKAAEECLKSRICELEMTLEQSKKELMELKYENEQKAALLKSQRLKNEELKKDNQDLSINICQNENKIHEYACKEIAAQQVLDKLHKEIGLAQKRIASQEDYIIRLEEELESLKCTSNADVAREKTEQMEGIIKNMQMELEKKDCQLNQLTKGATYTNTTPEKPESYKKKITEKKVYLEPKSTELIQLKFKLKDMQEALTAEIADKHDEIRRLKDDIKDLEDKLLQSDKQTQFKDDIIKELRKEVKVGRAKESLAEMLGLKGTPRAAMKNRIANLNGQMEEMKAHVFSLEARLAECNLPAVLSLRSRLNNAESSLLAMCNKMDYVRKYLENLKGDEELSIKCGVEALLSELREDVEWNKQTRRNLSLDEGTSVIVINHRSRSLPDNSLHRIPGKTQSESAVGAILTNKSLDDSSNQMSLPDTFQESKSYIQSITELENEFDETNSEIWRTWRSLKLWSESSGDVYSSNFEDIIKSTEEDNEALAKLATDLGKVLDEKEENESICNLDYLEGNLIELGRYLTKVNMMSHSSSSSDLEKHDSEKYDELGSLSKKVSMVISDSLSLVYEIKRKNVSQITPSVKVCLQDLVVSFSKILGHKNAFFEKLISLQRQQSEFSHTLIGRINEIDAGLSAYNGSANNLKNEIRKLFSVVLTKDSQIQKQINEITNLKILLSSMSKSDENNSDEISNLRRVVSNKDLQLIEKEELIHNLRTLNYTLQRTKVSRSSPSICNAGDFVEDIDDKMVQLEDTVKSIKGNVSSILMYLVRTQDKMSEFEDDSRNLVKNLAHIHQEIMSFKDVITTNMIGQGDIYNVNGLDEQLTEVAVKIEELLNAVEIFLCDSEKPDLNSLSESLRSKVMKLSYVAEYIKKSAVNEKSFLKSLTDENDSMKRKIRSLEEALAKEKSLSAKDSGRDEVIESLQENLRKACSDLDAIREEYEKLKVKKEEVEAKNQKVMEELQSKICGLQEASSQTRPTDTMRRLLRWFMRVNK